MTEVPEWSKPDLDLGDGHSLRWVENSIGKRIGAIIAHERDDDADCICEGTVWFDGSHTANWTLEAAADGAVTLSPSIACHCGDHGWVRSSRWVRA